MTMFHAEAQTRSVSSWLHTPDIHQCWDHELLPCASGRFPVDHMPTPHGSSTHPGATVHKGKPHTVAFQVYWGSAWGWCWWLHTHAGNHSTHGNNTCVFLQSVKTVGLIAEQVIKIKEGMIWKWIYNIELQRINQHIAVAGLICQGECAGSSSGAVRLSH